MNIVELNERNLPEALRVYKKFQAEICEQTGRVLPEDSEIEDSFYGTNGEGITYTFLEKGNCFGLVTIDKATAEIKNLTMDFSLLSKSDLMRVTEFTLKQFSAITLVFVWVNSLQSELMNFLEDYGFEYTGQQDYLDKSKYIQNYRYVYKRKR